MAVRVVIRLACSAACAALGGSSLMRLHQRVNSTVDYSFSLPSAIAAAINAYAIITGCIHTRLLKKTVQVGSVCISLWALFGDAHLSSSKWVLSS